MDLLKHKISAIKDQVANDNFIKERKLESIASALTQRYLSSHFGDETPSEKLLRLKADNNDGAYNSTWGHEPASKDLWERDDYNEVIPKLVIYWNKKLYESEATTDDFLNSKNELPSGPVKFYPEKSEKSEFVNYPNQFDKLMFGDLDFNFNSISHKVRDVIVTPDPQNILDIWVIEDSYVSFLPASDLSENMKSRLLSNLYKKIDTNFNNPKMISKEENDKISDTKEYIKNIDSFIKAANIDNLRISSASKKAAQISVNTKDSTYPIFTEIIFSGKKIAVPTLALHRAAHMTSIHPSCDIYYDEAGKKLIFLSETAYAIIDTDYGDADLWDTINMEAFTKGITARQVQKIEEVVTVEHFTPPSDLLERKPKLAEIIERQKVLVPKMQIGGIPKVNTYDEIINLAHEYIASYTNIVNERGVEIRKAVIPQHKLNTLSYVYEVDDIFWEYNPDIEVDELLAFFVSKGKNDNYQTLCLKILGIDYMLNYNALVDALIERRLLMIDNIKIDAVTKRILELKYEYLHFYASGNIYAKKKQLEKIQNDLIEYYGSDNGMRIIAAQNEILDERVPAQCLIISAEKDKQLELDINHEMFFESSFPPIATRSSIGVRNIREQFQDYFHKIPKLGGITDSDIEDGYFEPLDKASFIKKYILPNWKYKGRTYDFESSSWTSIADALKFQPERKPTKFNKKGEAIVSLSDYSVDDQITVKEIQRAIIAAYHERITRIKNDGSRIFNLFLKSEVTNSFQQLISQIWNEKYNNYSAAVLNKVPVFFRIARYFGPDNKLFRLKKVQVNGAKFSTARNNSALLAHEVGYGKLQPLDSKLLTPTGWINMGDVKIGDRVIGVDGRPTEVMGVFPQGDKEIYRITFDDGSSTECGKEHLWTFKGIHHRNPDRKSAKEHGWKLDTGWQTKDLGYFIEQGITNKRGDKKFNIPVVQPVHFNKIDLPIHPYVLGALLGDGSLSTENSVGFTNIDQEIIDRVSLFLPNDELRLRKQGKSECNYRISRSIDNYRDDNGHVIKNEITDAIKQLGLNGGHSYEKFIPDIYKYNSVENRILLLQGLMDTDGTVKKLKKKGKSVNSSASMYATTSKKLCEDVIFLVQSLGGIATVYEKKPSFTYKGVKKQGRLCYSININLPPQIVPFALTRKIQLHIPKHKYQPSRFITDIEYVGIKPAQCIKVANEDGLYVTDDFIVTHNTTTSLVTISHWMETGEASRVLTLTPKRVYEKFLREGKGAGNFRGCVPHINFIELYNAKPDVFLPVLNQKGEVIKWNLKHYEKDDLKTIEFYRQALAEIGRKADAMQNRRLEPDNASIEMIEETIAKFVPNSSQYKFFGDMIKKFESNKSYTIDKIQEEKEAVEAKQGAITPKEEAKLKAKYGRIFSDEVMDTLYAMKNMMIDEMGTFFPDVFKPKSIILATHVAIEDLRPSQVGIDEAIAAIDDVNDTRWSKKESREIPDARDKTLEWSFILNNNPISIERLNIDGIVVDEVHNFNELISKIRPRYYTKKRSRRSEDEITYLQLPIGSRDSKGRHVMRYYYSMPSETNKDKVNLLAIVMDIAAKNKDKKQNAIMLSATPFTEGPLHMFSVMNLVNRRRLKELNMASSYNFFMNFIWEAWKFDVTIDGRKGLFATIDKYRNNMGLCNFMAAFSDFKITDEEIEKLRPVKYIIPDDENRIGGITSYVPLTDVQKSIKYSIGEFIAGRIKEEDICRITRQEDIDEIDEDASSFDAEALVESGNLRKQEIMSARIFKAKSMQEKMVISPYLMGCLPEGVKLPPLDDILRHPDGTPILWEGKEVPAAPKHFVENSPKILYAINCIQSVLEKHEQDGTRPSGQIIYLNMGKDFVYQNVRYKGGVYQLIAEYLTHPVYRPDIGLVPSDIGVIHGGITDEGLVTEIQRKFNDGRIKVLLGSASIREGIDLQENSTAMYIINAEYNPTNAMQLEGRIWRQGNKWKNVRVVYVLAYDSIDVFIYSKLKNKINSVREIMRAGKCDLNETHTFSLDPGEVQINLTTNVDDLADLSWQNEERKLRMELERRNSEINLLRLIHKNYPKIKTEYDNLLKRLNYLSDELGKVKYQDLKDTVEHKIRSAEREKPIEEQMSAADIEKQAEELIADGTYKRTYEHVDFNESMSYTLFQQRLDVLRSNYKIARQWEGRKALHEKEIEDLKKQIANAEIERNKLDESIKANPVIEPASIEDLGKPDQRIKALAEADRFISKWKADLNRAIYDKTKQQLYWEAIIAAGFKDFEDYDKSVNRFTSGSDNDTVLNAYNSQVTAAGMKFSDVDDIIESQQEEIKSISDRINNKDREVAKLVTKYTKLLEDRKKKGKFSLYDQIAAYETTNYLVQ